MTIPELLEKKYLEWQSQLGKRKTLEEFAEYLGVSRTVLSNWLSGNRKPGTESLRYWRVNSSEFIDAFCNSFTEFPNL